MAAGYGSRRAFLRLASVALAGVFAATRGHDRAHADTCDPTTTCNANGVCDAAGQCVCNAGFAGPNCQ